MEETITLGKLAKILQNVGAATSSEFTAIAGSDYGHVISYFIGDDEYLIIFGDNGSTEYALSDTDEDLHLWLLSDGLNDEDSIIQMANTTGEIPSAYSAFPDAEGEFRVMVTHFFYDGDRSDWALDDKFADYQTASTWISAQS